MMHADAKRFREVAIRVPPLTGTSVRRALGLINRTGTSRSGARAETCRITLGEIVRIEPDREVQIAEVPFVQLGSPALDRTLEGCQARLVPVPPTRMTPARAPHPLFR